MTSMETTTIIRTRAIPERADGLVRAISSVFKGNRSASEVIVVVNGGQQDQTLVRRVSTLAGVRVIELGPDSFSESLLAGVEAAGTPLVGFLDDDDELLPGAVDARSAELSRQPEAALLVSNGYRERAGVRTLALENLSRVELDPLLALFDENWLPSCGGVFRKSMLPHDLFAGVPTYFEWTWLAFRVASPGCSIVALDEPCFVIHDSAASESKSPSYLYERPDVLCEMRTRATRADVRRRIEAHLSQALYARSVDNLAARRYGNAWRDHLRCLRFRSGWRYYRHTVRLLGFGHRLAG